MPGFDRPDPLEIADRAVHPARFPTERLGKPRFACTLDALKERWGSCGCFDVKNVTTAAPEPAAEEPLAAAAAGLAG